MGCVLLISNIDANNIESQTILVDTNVLLWSFYPNLVNVQNPKSQYSNFLFTLLNNDNKVIVLNDNLSEFVYVIEKTEYLIYLQAQHLNRKQLSFKSYRKNYTERQKVMKITQLALEQMKNIPNLEMVDKPYSKEHIFSFVTSYDVQCLDFYDYLAANHCNNSPIYLLTDDIDYKYCNFNLNIYTDNNKYTIS